MRALDICKLQARDLCQRSHTLIFGRSSRDDLKKMFLGKNATAYIASTTPGPGAYELRQQRLFSLFPKCQPGTTIGGPMANIDRVRTGPLAASYNSFTPGPGAYDDRGITGSPPKRPLMKQTRGEQGVHSHSSTSNLSHDSQRAPTDGAVQSHPSPAMTGVATATGIDHVRVLPCL